MRPVIGFENRMLTHGSSLGAVLGSLPADYGSKPESPLWPFLDIDIA
jgi:hypothetical protein